MRLELGKIKIKDIQFGEKTVVKEGTLYVNEAELVRILKEDNRIADVDVELARPGESIRIITVKDVIEPRVKVSGRGCIFPGILGKPETVGEGRTHVLDGVCVITAGKIVGFQEGIIDMIGPGAQYTPFSKTNNIVIVCHPEEGLSKRDHEAAVRIAGLKAAKYLGETGREIEPDEIKAFETPPLKKTLNMFPDLPRIAYVYMLQSQGLLHDTYVYGVDAKRIIPTFIYPTEIMDGAVISGNCVSACDKNTTYHHLNNPVIRDLYDRNGKEINFIGVIITNENVTLADKQRSSDYTSKLIEYIGADGVIITEEGFGNPDTDLIMNCKKLEDKGIKTVIIADEYAGRDGMSQSLADASQSADAMVSVGNANEVITLPKLDKVLGDINAAEVVAGGFSGSLREDGSIIVEIQAIIGSTNELGLSCLSAKEY